MTKILDTLIIAMLLICTSCLVLQAQGWERYLGQENVWEEGWTITTTNDEGLAFAGRKANQIWVVRLDQDGHILWEKTYLGENTDTIDRAYDILQTNDGGFAITGEWTPADSTQSDIFLLKVDRNGQQQWQQNFGSEEHDMGYGLAELEDGSLLMAGVYFARTVDNATDYNLASFFVAKVQADGNALWENTYGGDFADLANEVIPLPNGELAVFGITGIPAQGVDYAYLRLAENGDSLWMKTYGTLNDDWATKAIATQDGGFIQTGYQFGNGTYLVRYQENGDTLWTQSYDIGTFQEHQDIAQAADGSFYNLSTFFESEENRDFVLKNIDTDGVELWSKILGRADQWEQSRGIVITPKGKLALIGAANRSTGEGFQADGLVIQTEVDDNSLNYHVRGKVFIENDMDCGSEDGEGLAHWLIEAKGEQTFYTQTDENGEYDLLLDTGTYVLNISPKSPTWIPCMTDIPISINNHFGADTINFGIQPMWPCPWLKVDLSTPFLAPCATVGYSMGYENLGTINAENAFIEIIIPSELTVLESDLAWQQTDSLYRFDLPESLEPFAKNSFQLKAMLACDAVVNATHSLKARILPKEPCLPENEDWDGASIELNSYCDGDSIHFELRNIGEDMVDSLTYVVIEDVVILLYENFNLEAEESLSISLPANGKTYRLEAQQSVGHPGRSRPAMAIEGCMEGGGDDFSKGFVTPFYEDDDNDYISIDAQESLLSFSETQLLAAPKGIGNTRLIAPNQAIEYHIAFPIFQIDTNATLLRIVVRDSLSEWLDLTTFQATASSHDYELLMTETGVLKFVFNDIVPPANDTLYGFVKFRIEQKTDVPHGTLIENKVDIYRDYELPTEFGNYQHQVGKWTHHETLTHHLCQNTSADHIVSIDSILNLSFDLVINNEIVWLSTVVVEIDSLIKEGESQMWSDTLISSNGCDSIVIYNLTSSIERYSNAAMAVWPNPTKGQIVIQLPDHLKHIEKIQIVDVNGKLLINNPYDIIQKKKKALHLNLEGLLSGVYGILLSTKEKTYFIKIIKI